MKALFILSFAISVSLYGGNAGGGNMNQVDVARALSTLFSTELDEKVTILEQTTDQEYIVQSEETGEVFSVIYIPNSTEEAK